MCVSLVWGACQENLGNACPLFLGLTVVNNMSYCSYSSYRYHYSLLVLLSLSLRRRRWKWVVGQEAEHDVEITHQHFARRARQVGSVRPDPVRRLQPFQHVLNLRCPNAICPQFGVLSVTVFVVCRGLGFGASGSLSLSLSLSLRVSVLLRSGSHPETRDP